MWTTARGVRCGFPCTRVPLPGSAGQDIALTTTRGHPGWRVRTEVDTRIACTADAFIVKARLQAFEGDGEVFSRNWDQTIARDGV